MVMTCEQLRIQKNRAYIDYERETDITAKIAKLGIWKSLVAQFEDAYRQEVLGDYSITAFGKEGMVEGLTAKVNECLTGFVAGQWRSALAAKRDKTND